MKMWIAIAGGIAALAVVAWLIGANVPEEHVASVSAEHPATPERIYEIISDPSQYAEWRSGLKRVEIDGDRIVEHSSFGPLPYRIAERVPGRRFATAEAGGRGLGFAGAWTFEIEPAGSRTRLTITERGRVFNPFFRLLARFVFGYDKSLKQYHADLAKRLGR